MFYSIDMMINQNIDEAKKKELYSIKAHFLQELWLKNIKRR